MLQQHDAATLLPESSIPSSAIKQFADKHRLKIRRDSCGDSFILGKQFCKDMPDRIEYHSHIYDHEDGLHFGVCLMFSPSGGSESTSGVSAKWKSRRKKLLAAGFELSQDGDAEGIAFFSPHNKEQVTLALKLAGIRTRRELSPEQKSILAERLAIARHSKADIQKTGVSACI